MAGSENQEAPRTLTRSSVYLAALYAFPAFLVGFLTTWETGLGAWICSWNVVLVVTRRWDLRRHIWFWLTISVAFLLQVPIVVWIPWGDSNLTWICFLPVAIADYGVVYGLTKIVEKMMKSKDGADPEP